MYAIKPKLGNVTSNSVNIRGKDESFQHITKTQKHVYWPSLAIGEIYYIMEKENEMQFCRD